MSVWLGDPSASKALTRDGFSGNVAMSAGLGDFALVEDRGVIHVELVGRTDVLRVEVCDGARTCVGAQAYEPTGFLGIRRA